MSKRYEIDENNVVRIFIDDSEFPMIIQPHWPNGESWIDSLEAENWATLCIASMDPEATLYAPAGRDLEPRKKLVASEIALISEAEKSIHTAENQEDREAAIEAMKQLRTSLGF